MTDAKNGAGRDGYRVASGGAVASSGESLIVLRWRDFNHASNSSDGHAIALAPIFKGIGKRRSWIISYKVDRDRPVMKQTSGKRSRRQVMTRSSFDESCVHVPPQLLGVLPRFARTEGRAADRA